MIEIKKPVTRKSGAIVRDGSKRRNIVIAIYPNDTIGLRPLGTRREEIITIDSAWSLGVKQRVAKERAEKKAARKAKIK